MTPDELAAIRERACSSPCAGTRSTGPRPCWPRAAIRSRRCRSSGCSRRPGCTSPSSVGSPALLRHSTSRMTLETYTQVTAAQEREAADLLERMVGG